jgi:TetR/AcrR family transcriptional repressor of bet genes
MTRIGLREALEGVWLRPMTQVVAPKASRRTPADKHDERRKALAESALRTLGELGYARASLREIANNSEFSHGVVHYYFNDRLELIIYCVRYYKQRCVHRYDDVVAEATSPEDLAARFGDKLVETIVEEAPMHRLWYDLRSQSMFEESLREAVAQIDQSLEDMIARVLGRYAELAGVDPAIASPVAYGMFDGIFQQALLGHLYGRDGVLEDLRAQVVELMPMLLAPRA